MLLQDDKSVVFFSKTIVDTRMRFLKHGDHLTLKINLRCAGVLNHGYQCLHSN